jgi:hypothetical protein
MNFKNYEENEYNLNSNMLTMLYKPHISYPRRSGLVGGIFFLNQQTNILIYLIHIRHPLEFWDVPCMDTPIISSFYVGWMGTLVYNNLFSPLLGSISEILPLNLPNMLIYEVQSTLYKCYTYKC